VQEGRGKDDLRWSRLLMVCQRERGLSEEEDTRLDRIATAIPCVVLHTVAR